MLLLFIFNLFLLQQIYVIASDFVAVYSPAYSLRCVFVVQVALFICVMVRTVSIAIACGFYSSIYDIRPSAHKMWNKIKSNLCALLRCTMRACVSGMHIARMHISLYVRRGMLRFQIDVANWPGVFYCLFQIAICVFFYFLCAKSVLTSIFISLKCSDEEKSCTNQLKYHSSTFVLISFGWIIQFWAPLQLSHANRNKFIRKWSVDRLYSFDGALNCGMWISVCCLRHRWRRRTTIWQHQTATIVTAFFSSKLVCIGTNAKKHSTWCLATQNKILFAFFRDGFFLDSLALLRLLD